VTCGGQASYSRMDDPLVSNKSRWHSLNVSLYRKWRPLRTVNRILLQTRRKFSALLGVSRRECHSEHIREYLYLLLLSLFLLAQLSVQVPHLLALLVHLFLSLFFVDLQPLEPLLHLCNTLLRPFEFLLESLKSLVCCSQFNL
jgi:hypothetical protein